MVSHPAGILIGLGVRLDTRNCGRFDVCSRATEWATTTFSGSETIEETMAVWSMELKRMSSSERSLNDEVNSGESTHPFWVWDMEQRNTHDEVTMPEAVRCHSRKMPMQRTRSSSWAQIAGTRAFHNRCKPQGESQVEHSI